GRRRLRGGGQACHGAGQSLVRRPRQRRLPAPLGRRAHRARAARGGRAREESEMMASESSDLTGSPDELFDVSMIVNGVARSARVPARRLLSDFLRHDLRLTGTHVGCEHGVCGACTVLIDGVAARSCLTLAVTNQGARVTTVEGLAQPDGTLS